MGDDSLHDGTVIIYGLADPITGELRYVGKTWYSLLKRRKQHLNHSKNRHVRAWLSALREAGAALPEIFEIERVPRESWAEAETFWIGYFKSIGCSLLNILVGAANSVPMSESTRAKIAEGRAKWLADPANIEKLRLGASEAWRDPVKRQRNIEASRKAMADPAFRAAASARKKADWARPEYRESVRAGQASVDRTTIAKNFWNRPEYRERQAAAKIGSAAKLRGRKQSPEVVAKRVEGIKRAALARRLSAQTTLIGHGEG